MSFCQRIGGWTKQLLTGANDQTLAIGRVMGAIVFVLMIVLISAAAYSIEKAYKPAAEWSTYFTSLTTFVPATILSIGGLIGLTHFSEPKQDA